MVKRVHRAGRPAVRLLPILLVSVALLVGACSSQPAAPAATKPAASPAASAGAPPAPAKAPTATPPEASRLVPPFKVLVPTASYYPEVFEAAETVMQQLKTIGLQPNILTHPTFQTYTEQWRREADWGLGFGGYNPRSDRLEPAELLKYWSCAEAKEGGRNEANYCSPEFEQAYKSQLDLVDSEKRRPFVLKAQEILARDLPSVTVHHEFLRHVYNKEKYGNVVSVPGVGTWNAVNFSEATPLTSNTVFKASAVSQMPALNPMADSIGVFDHDVIRVVYDTLTRLGAQGTPEPLAAERITQVNNLAVDVVVRSGMKFHDGRPVTVDDVMFTYNYMMQIKPVFYLSYVRPIDRVEKTGPQTMRVHLKTPYGPLLSTTFASIPILPQHIWKDAPDPRKATQVNLTASGAFKFKSQQANQSYHLERFADYHRPVKSSEVIVRRYANKETQFLALAKGDEFFLEPKGLPTEQVLEAKKYPFLQIVAEPSIDVRYMVFNMRDKLPFQDYHLRHAVAHLLDFKTIEEVIGKGMLQAGRGVIAPGNKYFHNTAIPSKEGDGVHYHQFDPAKAKKILQDAGYEWDKDGKLYFPKGHKPKMLP